jgi:hypothetical protein
MSTSFDHLVRGIQKTLRDGEAERLGGLEVDEQLEFSRLLDGKVCRSQLWLPTRQQGQLRRLLPLDDELDQLRARATDRIGPRPSDVR